jgi:hypothetical protein
MYVETLGNNILTGFSLRIQSGKLRKDGCLSHDPLKNKLFKGFLLKSFIKVEIENNGLKLTYLDAFCSPG